jgi:urease accessory protein
VNALAAEPPAQLDLSFARRGERTVLDRRLFAWPFVLTRTFQLDPTPAHMLTVIVQTSSGAVHGEDRLGQHFHLGPGAAAHLTTQGAASVHRAHPGVTTNEAVRIGIAPGGFLEYLPEPRILFPDAALNQTIDIDCAPDGIAVVSDAFTLHDPERRGRSFRRLQSKTVLRRGGEPVMIDRLDITELPRGPTAQYLAFGTMFMAAQLPTETLERLALQLSATLAKVAGLYAAASLLPGSAGVGVRLAGRDLRCLRLGLELAWIAFRCQLYGAPPASRRKGEVFANPP